MLNAGYLVSTVLEVMHNHKDIAILDTSAACHMPDVLEVPYRPPVYRGGEPGKKAFTYLLTRPLLPRRRCHRRVFVRCGARRR